MFNKAAIKCFAALWCGLILAFFFCIGQPVASQTAYAQPQATPTPSTGNATISLAVPGSSSLTGHAGTKITITGQGFKTAASTMVNIYATLTPQQCVPGGALYAFAPNTATITNGSFTFDGRWPHGTAERTPPEDPGSSYYVCALTTEGEAVASSQAFTVAPALTADPSKDHINPGDQVTITGTNWIPPQQLTVDLISTAGQSVSQKTTAPDQSGNFSVTLTLDPNIPPGQYIIQVTTTGDPQGPQYRNSNPVIINAPVTPTPSPSPSPTPSPTPTVAPTPSPTPPGSGDNSGSSQGGSPGMTILIFTLGGLGVLMVITGLIMFAASAPSTRRAS